MSPNVELVQNLYAAFGRGDIDALVAGCAPNVRWRVNGRPSDFPMIGTWTGPEGVREFFGQLAETEEADAFEPREFYASEDMVFVLGRYAWTMRKNGRKADAEWVHVFRIEDGKVASFTDFTDTAQFAEAWRS